MHSSSAPDGIYFDLLVTSNCQRKTHTKGMGNNEIFIITIVMPYYTPVKDGTYYVITGGTQAGGRVDGRRPPFFVRSISPRLC